MNNIETRIRLLTWYALMGSIFTLLAIRLGWLQLLKGDLYVEAADDNRFFSLTIPAPRGLITDRYEEPVVWNERSYVRVSDVTQLYPVMEPIPRETALELLATDSAQVSTHYERHVAMPEALASVVGYVGDITAEDLQRNPNLVLSDQLGKSGLERLYNQQLQGIAGKDVYEINALGLRQRVSQHQPPQIGQELRTTVDPYLSQVAYQALGENKGSVVILDADTGEILTLVNSPSYNAQIMNSHPIEEQEIRERQQTIQAWLTDATQPFFNRATSGAYPPGSVFKMVTALAGLENESITTETEVVDEGILKVGEYAYGNWYFRQHGRTEGTLNLVRAIARSNDIYFYKAAEWAGPKAVANMARLLGLGEITGLGLGTEQAGLVPDPEWKERTLQEPWYLGNTYHYGIGQGDILVTPIQIAQYIQALANQGTMCAPHLTHLKDSPCHEVGVQDKNLETVLMGMIEACSPGGTAYPFFPRNQALRDASKDVAANLDRGVMACKTGTAEFGPADEQGYRATHGWFVSIVQPQLASQELEAEETTATDSAQVTPVSNLSQVDPNNKNQLYAQWRREVAEHGFPSRLIFVALVESNEENKFREGSQDAAPVIKEVLTWMEGREILPSTPLQPVEKIGD